MTTPGGAPPQLSPDGRWWWTGTEWVPAPAPAYPAYPAYGYQAGPPTTNDGLAITSLVSSLVWACGLGSIVAVITGHLSRSRARKAGDTPGALSLAGIILGYVGLVGMLGFILLVVNGRSIANHMGNDLLPRLDLQDAADLEYEHHGSYGTFVDDEGLREAGFVPAPGVTLLVLHADESSFCLTASRAGHRAWYWDSTARHPKATTTPC